MMMENSLFVDFSQRRESSTISLKQMETSFKDLWIAQRMQGVYTQAYAAS